MRRYLPYSPSCNCYFTFTANHPNSSSSSSKADSNKSKNYYEILEVPISAGQDEIKSAYFQKSKEWHPDLNPENQSSEEFQRIKRAYDVLRSEEKRKRYNAFLSPTQLFHEKIRRNSSQSKTFEFEEFEQGEESTQNHQTTPPVDHRTHYNFYQATKENSKDSQMSGWNGPGLSYKQELLLFIKYLIFFGISVIFFFHTSRWYIRHRREKRLNSLVAKEELVKSFLRQREFSGIDSPVQREMFARLFGDYIDEAERRKQEDPEYNIKLREKQGRKEKNDD